MPGLLNRIVRPPAPVLPATSRQLRCHALTDRLSLLVNLPLFQVVTQICVNPRKLNVSGFPAPSRSRISLGILTPEFNQPGFLRVRVPVHTLPAAPATASETPFGLVPILKPQHKIVGVTDDDHIAPRQLSAPLHQKHTDRARNAGRYWQAAAGITAPCGVPTFHPSNHCPSSDTPAVGHFPISRSILGSAILSVSIRSSNLSWLMLSKKPLNHRHQ